MAKVFTITIQSSVHSCRVLRHHPARNLKRHHLSHRFPRRYSTGNGQSYTACHCPMRVKMSRSFMRHLLILDPIAPDSYGHFKVTAITNISFQFFLFFNDEFCISYCHSSALDVYNTILAIKDQPFCFVLFFFF